MSGTVQSIKVSKKGFLNLLFTVLADPMHCACQSERPAYLSMRGLWDTSLLDVYYTPVTTKNQLRFKGYETTEINYNPVAERWELSVVFRETEAKAYSYSSYHSFILGRSQWLVQNDGGI